MEVGSSSLPGTTCESGNLLPLTSYLLNGGLAQLARALAWHARGHRFDPDILHDPDLSVMRAGNHNYQLLITDYSSGKRSLTY